VHDGELGHGDCFGVGGVVAVPGDPRLGDAGGEIGQVKGFAALDAALPGR
jgi:hypothetical protein